MPPMPPPPPPEHKGHEKIVDLDNDKDQPPPPDAKYLAQKNNRVDVETRARDTNMVKIRRGRREASSPSDRTDQQVGGEKEKIAQLEEQKSKLGKSAPDVTPHVNPELSQPKDQPQHRDRSLLALRDPTPQAARADARDRRPVAPARRRRRDAAALARRARKQERSLAPDRRQAGQAGPHRQGLRVPVRRRRGRRTEAGPAGALDPSREVREAARAGEVGRRELHPRGEPRQPDGAQHARGAVRRLHRADAPEHPRAVGLRSARGVGREGRLEPLQQPQPDDRAGDRPQRRRHRRPDWRGAGPRG